MGFSNLETFVLVVIFVGAIPWVPWLVNRNYIFAGAILSVTSLICLLLLLLGPSV